MNRMDLLFAMSRLALVTQVNTIFTRFPKMLKPNVYEIVKKELRGDSVVEAAGASRGANTFTMVQEEVREESQKLRTYVGEKMDDVSNTMEDVGDLLEFLSDKVGYYLLSSRALVISFQATVKQSSRID